jgi:hypothetical protein
MRVCEVCGGGEVRGGRSVACSDRRRAKRWRRGREPDVPGTLGLQALCSRPFGYWRRGPVMDRRRFLLTSLAGAMVGPRAGEAQRGVRRIGLVSIGADPDPSKPSAWDPFFQELRTLGHIEGQTVTLERRFAGGRPERLNEFVADLSRLRLDVIVGTGELEIFAAKRCNRYRSSPSGRSVASGNRQRNGRSSRVTLESYRRDIGHRVNQRPYPCLWVRVLILIRSITSTTWGHEAWPQIKPILRRALEMRRQIARAGWSN